MGHPLAGGANRLIGAWPVVERAGFAEDAQTHIVHRQAGGNVVLLHRFFPGAVAFRGRSGGLRRWPWLRLEFVDSAVEQGFISAVLRSWVRLRHWSSPIARGRHVPRLNRHSSSAISVLQLEDLLVAELAIVDAAQVGARSIAIRIRSRPSLRGPR